LEYHYSKYQNGWAGGEKKVGQIVSTVYTPGANPGSTRLSPQSFQSPHPFNL